MQDTHHRDLIEDYEDAAQILDTDRKIVETEKKYDDERQNAALAVINQTMNSVALILSQTSVTTVYTGQQFVSYLFLYLAIIVVMLILKNTIYVYKTEISLTLGANLYDIAFQFLSIIHLFFFYLLVTLVRTYFEINQNSIAFIIFVFGLYLLFMIVWNRAIRSKKII